MFRVEEKILNEKSNMLYVLSLIKLVKNFLIKQIY